MIKAIVLFSGGIDSTVILAQAIENKRQCLALSFNYGQNHLIELEAAKQITAYYGVQHLVLNICSSSFGHVPLLGHGTIPRHRSEQMIANSGIAPTYVPARNLLFLSFAAAQAELHNAQEIYFGPNANDQSSYPDCRPLFVQAFQTILNTATKQSVDLKAPQLITPLIHLTKQQIFEEAGRLKVPLEMTWSCYAPQQNRPCLECDACRLRKASLV